MILSGDRDQVRNPLQQELLQVYTWPLGTIQLHVPMWNLDVTSIFDLGHLITYFNDYNFNWHRIYYQN